MRYYRIRNWGKYQHYKNSDNKNYSPSKLWLKLYRDLIVSHEWITLNAHGRNLLIALLCLSNTKGEIKLGASSIKVAAKLDQCRINFYLNKLVESGFIEVISEIDVSNPRKILGSKLDRELINSGVDSKGGEFQEILSAMQRNKHKKIT